LRNFYPTTHHLCRDPRLKFDKKRVENVVEAERGHDHEQGRSDAHKHICVRNPTDHDRRSGSRPIKLPRAAASTRWETSSI
jgi:hypothetical protein